MGGWDDVLREVLAEPASKRRGEDGGGEWPVWYALVWGR